MTLNLDNFNAAMKQLYTSWKVENLVYKNNPFFAMVAKQESTVGSEWKVPLIYGNPQGRSATFAKALANQTDTLTKAFLVTRAKDYSIASVSNELIEASKSDQGAFLKAMQTQIDGALHSLARSAAIALFRTGSGSIGQVVSTQSGAATTITLEQSDDITNFEVGQALVNDTVNGGGTVSTTPFFVVAVDRDAGTIEVSASIGGAATTATLSGLTASKYIFVEGDYDAKIAGLQAWLPASVTSTPFFGVDRTADKTRLAGIYMDRSDSPIEEALIDCVTRIHREGGSPDTIFMDFTDYANLEKALGTKQYIEVTSGSEGQFAFKGLSMNGPKGVLKVIPDQNCVPGYAFVLQMDTWKLGSLGPVPKIFNTDGLQVLRNSDADSVQVRCNYYANLACNSPGHNGSVKLR